MTELHHEIRSPLNTILNTIELGLMENPGPSMKRYLETIKKSATGLLALLDDVISLSGEEEYGGSRVPFFLTSLLEEIRAAVEVSMQANSVSMVLNISDDTPESLLGPKTRIWQVLSRLLNFVIGRLNPKQIDLNIFYDSAEELWFEIEAMPAPSDLWDKDLNLENDHSLLICRSLLNDEGKVLEIERRGQSLIFTFSIAVKVISKTRDRLFKSDFYKEVSEVLMVNSDNLSSELTGRRLRLEGISVRNMPSLEEAAEYMAGNISAGCGDRWICLMNWEDVKSREDLGITFLRSAAGLEQLPAVLMELPAVEMMNLAARRGFPDSEAGASVGLVMKPAVGRKVLMEISRVLGWEPEEIFADKRGVDTSESCSMEKIFTGLKVLVVEDEQINQKILVEIHIMKTISQ